jgi:hypothetical protein
MSALKTTGVMTVLLLSPGVGSGVGLVTVAVLVTEPVALAGTENTTVTFVVAPFASVPNAHGKPPAHGAVADTKVKPAGVGSTSDTVCAFDGPLFVTASV